jgi:peptidoglycan/LPS O-acetylase OafA/YrhL
MNPQYPEGYTMASTLPAPTAHAGRIPSLDGLRAISITMVLLAHLTGTAGLPTKWLPFAWGRLGVFVFFIISGYLITSLLMKERERTGTISLGKFYFRRTMRIFPAMYVFILAVVVLEKLGVVKLLPGDVLTAATYTMNFHSERAWWLGHTWSLAVEEQFYLIWPAVVVVVGLAGGLRAALGAVVAAPILRVVVFYAWPEQRANVEQAFPFVFDSLATGCALAILRQRLWADRRYRALLESRFFGIVPLVVVAAYTSSPSVGLSLLVGQTVINVGIALCVDWAIRFPESRVGRILNTRPFIWVGTISYSLYLWQQLFLCRDMPAWFTTFPLNIVLAFAAATASFYLVEQPFLRLRERMEGMVRRPSLPPPGRVAPAGTK